MAKQRALLLFVDDLVEGFLRLIAASELRHRPINLGNRSRRGCASSPSHRRDDRLALQIREPAAAGGLSDSACPDISRARKLLDLSRACPSHRLERTIAFFNRLLQAAAANREGSGVGCTLSSSAHRWGRPGASGRVVYRAA